MNWETENLRHGGHCWAVSSNSATLYKGVGKSGNWWVVKVHVTFKNLKEFYKNKERWEKEFL